MRVTVLGKSPSWQDAGGACSGYLIEHGESSLLLDCGNGVFSKLRLHRDYVDLDAVLISHMHADHFLDLVPFAYALTYAPRQQPVPVERWPGHRAPGAARAAPAAGRDRDAARDRRRLGAGRPDRQRVRGHRVRRPLDRHGRRARGALPRGAALHRDLRGQPDRPRRPGPVHLRRRLPAGARDHRGRSRHRSADRRSHAPAPGAHRRARAPDSLRGRRARPRRRARSASSSPTSPTSSTRTGRASRGPRASGPPSRSPARAPSSRSDRTAPRVVFSSVSRQRDLFVNFDRVRREMDELFGDVWGRDRADLAARERVLAARSTSTTATSRRARRARRRRS